MNNCPLCDPSGSIAGLIGPQFCGAGSRLASSPLNPRAPVYQSPASSTRIVSLPRPPEGAPGSGSNTRPPEGGHASEEIQPPEERRASEEIQPPEERRASEEIHPPEERRASEEIQPPEEERASEEIQPPEERRTSGEIQPPEEERTSEETQSTGEGHGSEERYASQETQSPRKRHASEDTGCPQKRQSLSPPLQKITSRGGSSSPEPAHSVRGGTSAPVAAPTPDVVARPPVDEEIHETPKIQSHDPSPPLDQDQEKKPDRKPGPTWANVAQITKRQTNQSHLKINVRSAKPKNLDWSAAGSKWPPAENPGW
ncbi:hypothetical protein LB503_002300 [Fusarium chuoi]|nr:hypothetical protein LB503_002300 [Fusarium chuoi]